MDETVDYESELDEQLQGQRAALLEIQEALAAEPSEELEEVSTRAADAACKGVEQEMLQAETCMRACMPLHCRMATRAPPAPHA